MTTCLSGLTTEGPNKEHSAATAKKKKKKPNRENLGEAKRREEMPAQNMSCQPPRNPHAGIYLGWEMTCHQEGPELDQRGHKEDDCPETTWKPAPLP